MLPKVYNQETVTHKVDRSKNVVYKMDENVCQ